MRNRTDRTYYGILALGMLGIYIIIAGQLHGIFFPPDEYGYFANAAAFLGKDWSGVSALHSYYSFGYSLLLTPFMGLIENPVLLYRAAILLNVVFACIHGGLLYGVLKELFPDAEKGLLAVAGCAGAFYPSVLVYSYYTLSEVLLNLLFILLVYELIRFIKEPGMMGAVLLGLTLGYTYYVHMRTLGILISLVLTLGILAYRDRKLRRYLAVLTAVLVACLAAGAFLKGYLQDTLYREVDAALLGGNDYQGQFAKLEYLFSGQGILDFVVSFLGKLFYLGNTTFCIFYWGIFHVLKKAVRVVKNLKKQCSGEGVSDRDFLFVYLLGAALFTSLISAYFMMWPGRVDSILYGRYNEIIVPVFVCLGIFEMLSTAWLKKGTALFIACHAVCATMLNLYISIRDVTTYLPDFAVGIAYAAGMHPKTTGDIINYPYIMGSLFSIGIALIVYLIQGRKLSYLFLGTVAVINLCIGLRIMQINILPHQRDNLENQRIAETIERLDTDSREIYLLHSQWNEYVDVIQYYLPDQRIHIIREEELDITQLREEDFILTYRSDERNAAMEMLYGSQQKSYHMNLYFNEMGTGME